MTFKIDKNKSKLFKLSDKLAEAENFQGFNLKNHGKDIIIYIELDQITIKEQVRKDFDQDSIKNLANSIKEDGLLYPILVMETSKNTTLVKDKKFQLVVGENRFRAFQYLKKTTIPARVIEYTEDKTKIGLIQLTENIHRKNLNPIELADSLMKLKKELNLTLDQLSKRVGRSVSSLKDLSRISKLTNKEKEKYNSKGFKELQTIIDAKNKKSTSDVLSKKSEQLSLFKETKTGLKINSISLNFKKESKEELQQKIKDFESFLKLAKQKLKKI